MSQFYYFTLNVLLVVALSALAAHFVLILPRRVSPWIIGAVFGACTVFVMQNKIYIADGRYFDFRHIIMALAGYSGGPVSGLMAAAVSGVYRFSLGGVGVSGGLINVFTFGLVGSWLGRVMGRRRASGSILFWLGIGFLFGLLALAIIPAAPPWNEGSLLTAKKTALPLLVLTPLATALVFKSFSLIQENMKKMRFLDSLLQRSPLMMCAFFSDGLFLVNARLSRNTALLDHMRQNAPAYYQNLFTPARPGEKAICFRATTTEFRTADNSVVTLHLAPALMPQGKAAAIALLFDVTEARRVQEQVASLSRFELIGQMAAGVAHEIRNPMTTVRGFLQLLNGREKYADQRGYFDLMIEELDSANSIIAEFLAMGRTKTGQLTKFNLNEVVAALEPLLRAQAAEFNCALKVNLGVVPNLLINEKEIRQLILNMAMNGFEAMPQGGSLTLTTLLDGDDVILTVQDEGHGIPPELRERVGTPFFTTKENGTGLGLGVCYGIAARHNAQVVFATGTGGTAFSIRFPLPEPEGTTPLKNNPPQVAGSL